MKESRLTLLIRPTERIGRTGLQVLEHSSRTAVTAVVSMLAARLCHLPQSYWAPITTLVISQSSPGSTLAVSWQRFIGTALGAAIGGFVATYFGPDMLVFVQASLRWGYPAQHSKPIVARIDSAESGWRSCCFSPGRVGLASRFRAIRRSLHRNRSSTGNDSRMAGEQCRKSKIEFGEPGSGSNGSRCWTSR